MRSISIRDLRNNPDLLEQSVEVESVALTSDSRAFALVVGLRASEDPADLERLIRQARAQSAVSRIRTRAQAEGLDHLSADEVGAEIRQTRRDVGS